MRFFKPILFICLITELLGCGFYEVKERKYLWITFNDSKLHPPFLENYIDSVRNKDVVIPDSILYIFKEGNKLDEQERLIHFENPDEWYLVIFDSSPGWIAFIYNPKISNHSINQREKLSKPELSRIENRYRKEVLNVAEKYGKDHHLPDSIIYN
jgi:hypothetical protein